NLPQGRLHPLPPRLRDTVQPDPRSATLAAAFFLSPVDRGRGGLPPDIAFSNSEDRLSKPEWGSTNPTSPLPRRVQNLPPQPNQRHVAAGRSEQRDAERRAAYLPE